MKEALLELLEVFIILLPFVLIYFYFLPAGVFYYFFYINPKRYVKAKIQKRFPSNESIKNEITSSVLSLVLFTFQAAILYETWRRGYTKIYLSLSEYSLGYAILSFFVLVVLHDSYFYWTHRFMHWPKVYKYFHKMHHKSLTPTPWAVFRSQPLETIIQFAFYPIVLTMIPIHFGILMLYVTYNVLVNTGGHTGFEFIPNWMKYHWFFKWNNCVTHHDIHHSKFNYNFGLYFNFWDRLMGTFMNDLSKDLVVSDQISK